MKQVATDMLRNAFGNHIVLTDQSDESCSHRLLAEFEFGLKWYAVLQSELQRKADEVSFFQILRHSEEPFFELESIDDEDEWETVSELYDEIVFTAIQSEELED